MRNLLKVTGEVTKSDYRCGVSYMMSRLIPFVAIPMIMLLFLYGSKTVYNPTKLWLDRVTHMFSEFQALIDYILKSILSFVRYGTVASLVIASVYGFVRYRKFRILRNPFRNTTQQTTTLSLPDQVHSEMEAYSISVPETCETKPYNDWEKTVEDCWYTLNIASLRMKNCKEKMTSTSFESKRKIQKIAENMKKIEEHIQEDQAAKTDVGSNTDILADYFLKQGFPNLVGAHPSLSQTSFASFTSSSDSAASQIPAKYNLMEKVMEIRDNLNLGRGTTAKKRFSSRKNTIQRPINPPPIPPIQQWSMPREIFTFSSASATSKFSKG